MFPFRIISMHHVEDDGKVPLHDQGSNDIADLEQQNFTALSNLDSFKEEEKSHPNVSLMSFTQPLRLDCSFLED